MQHVTHIARKEEWNGDIADTIALTYQDRCRRRMTMVTEGGEEFLLNLPRPAMLEEGDVLLLPDDRAIVVKAAPEELMQVTMHDPLLLVRLAWHIGNRHLPAQISQTTILLGRDHVIADMLRGLGGEVENVECPFQPEGGAYSGGGHHHHHHDHDDHDHDHEHEHHHG